MWEIQSKGGKKTVTEWNCIQHGIFDLCHCYTSDNCDLCHCYTNDNNFAIVLQVITVLYNCVFLFINLS